MYHQSIRRIPQIKSFYEIDGDVFVNKLSESIKNEIEGKGKEYILGIDEEEFKNHLIDKYSLEPLEVDFKNEKVEKPLVTKEKIKNTMYDGGYNKTEVYTFTITYRFTGSPILFRVKPKNCKGTTTHIYLNEEKNTVSFSFKLYKQDQNEFNREKNRLHQQAFTNMDETNSDALDWNKRLPGIVNTYFQLQKVKYKEENDFFAAINVNVDKNTTSVFTVPTIKRKIISQPTISKNKEFSSVPTMSNEMYYDTLKVVYDAGKSMERKPSLYKGKDEEGLRDLFLFLLETRYEGITATGETFNCSGKTDMILKYAEDGSNLFVAECKFWHGCAEFLRAISQLFDTYLTWHDSKVALLLFVTNKSFTNVIKTLKTEIKSHPYFEEEKGQRRETSFSYIFHLPQDEEKRVLLEILAFHYDKK